MMSWYVGALLVLLAALLLRLELLVYAMYVLLGVLVSSRYAARRWVDSVRAERECSRLTAEIGDVVAVVVSVRNASWLPVPWLLLEDILPREALVHRPPSLEVQGRRMRLAMLPPFGRRHMLYQLRCNRRGYYQLGPLVVETGDLFGLHRRWRVVSRPHFLLVLPNVLPPEGYDIASRRPIGEVRLSYRIYEDPTRIAGVRRYEAGDPLNRIHWRATARTAVLQSKAYEPSTVAGATILIDFHRDAHDPRHEPHRSELAVTAAASIAHALYEIGQQVGLVTNGRDAAERVRTEGWRGPGPRSRRQAREAAARMGRSDRLQPLLIPTLRGPQQLWRILETLGRLELSDGLRLPQLLLETAGRLPRDASLIALLPRVDVQDAVALGELRRRGLAVTAVVNVFDVEAFAAAAGLLENEQVPARHLRDEAAVSEICRELVLR